MTAEQTRVWSKARGRAMADLKAAHRDEWDQLMAHHRAAVVEEERKVGRVRRDW